MIGVIAGTGTLPGEACKNLLSQHKPFCVIVLFPEDNANELESIVAGRAELITQPFYKAHEMLELLKHKGVTHVLFIGKVDKRHLLQHIKLDWFALKLLGSSLSKSDKDLMEILLAELATHGIQTIHQDSVLGGLLVPPGILTGKLTTALATDIKIGMQAAFAIAHANIGQTVVVKNGMVLAVEAIEGTDACIKRGLDLAKNGIVICKAARHDQNRKFDLPTLGPSSLRHLLKGDIAAIAWLSSSTFIAQKDLFVQKAQGLGIVLQSVDQILGN